MYGKGDDFGKKGFGKGYGDYGGKGGKGKGGGKGEGKTDQLAAEFKIRMMAKTEATIKKRGLTAADFIKRKKRAGIAGDVATQNPYEHYERELKIKSYDTEII